MRLAKIIYIANARLPTEKAHGLQIAKMCAAFVRSGFELFLVLPDRDNKITEDIHQYYQMDAAVKIYKLWSSKFRQLNNRLFDPLIFYLQNITFAWSVRKFVRGQPEKNVVLYTRDLLSVLFAPRGLPIVFEAHNWPEHFVWLFRALIRRITAFVVITQALKRLFINANINEAKIFVAPDAVDIKDFTINLSRIECRQKLGLPVGKKIALYSGHLYSWKGAYNIIEAAKQFSEDTLFVVVGGMEADIKSYQDKVSLLKLETKIMVVGRKKYEEIPYYLQAADSLLLPNTSESKISALYTSPMKLFEYMAARRPIVASSLPSIREILRDDNAIMVEPDNATALANGIKLAHAGGEMVDRRVAMAAEEVKSFTWDSRVAGIVNFLDMLL